MYSTHNEGKSAVAERFIRTIKKRNKYMTSISKNVYIDKLADMVNEPWAHVIEHLNGEEIVGTFYEKELQKTNQKKFAIEKVIKRKGNELYIKWKGYEINSWIDEKK